jgi:hypothetical protein
MYACQVFLCYTFERLEQAGDSDDKAQKPDKQPLPVGELTPAALPVNRVEPPSRAPILQQDIGTNPPGNPGGGDEANNPDPMPVRVVNDPLLTRVVEDDELGEFEARTLRYARWGFGVAIVTLVLALGTGAVFFGQFSEMANQTDLLGRAARQARTDAKDAGIATAKQLVIAQEQANAAKDSVKAIQTQMRIMSRPWVNAESFEIKKMVLPPNGGFSIYGDLTMKNTGASIANNGWTMMVAVGNGTSGLNRQWNVACKSVDTQMKASRQASKAGAGDFWPIGFVLAPNQETNSLGMTISGDFLPRDIAQGFYLLGCAKYTDQFLAQHTTMFCFQPDAAVYRPDMSVNTFKLRVCNGFQKAD